MIKRERVIAILMLVVVACASILSAEEAKKTISMALVDTGGRDAVVYKPFIDFAHAAGFSVTYLGTDELMDTQDIGQALAQYDCAFFIFPLEFLQGMHRGVPMTQHVLQGMQRFCSQQNKLVGLVFPTLVRNKQVNIVRELAPIFAQLGIQPPKTELRAPVAPGADLQQYEQDVFFYTTNSLLVFPLEGRSAQYHTTLQMPHAGFKFYHNAMQQLMRGNHSVKLLPLQYGANKVVKKASPYGLYWFNSLQKNHVFVCQSSFLTFSGLAENFHICPSSFSKRKRLLSGLFSTLMDLKTQVKGKRSDDQTVFKAFAKAKKIGNRFGRPLSSAGSSPLKKTAWMEIPIFEDKKYNKETPEQRKAEHTDREKRRDRLIAYILDAGLDCLWISLTPNTMYSTIAKYKQNESSFRLSISRFTKKLSDACKKHKKPIPKILVGFEMMGNIHAPDNPKKPSHDLYGNSYFDLPSPIDREYWNREIKEPFKVFLEKWKDPELSHGVPIAGVVIDLEMYGRRKTGTFFSTMGFDEVALQKYLRKTPLLSGKQDNNQIVEAFIKKQHGKKFYAFLEQEAREIGHDLKTFFEQQIPNCQFGFYLPMLSADWFYKGLIQGASDASKPLPLLTFNAEFNSYQDWFKQNNINVHHLSVLLLSKVARKKDFKWVDNILQHHHGVWFNRFSRLVEDPDGQDWTNVEKTPLDSQGKQEFMDYLAKVR